MGDGRYRPVTAIVHFFYKSLGWSLGLWSADPCIIVEFHIGRIIIPTCAADAKEHLKSTAVLDSLFSGALEHWSEVEAEGAAA